MKRLLLTALIAIGFALPVTAGMKETTEEQERTFIPFSPPPPPYTYQKGSVQRWKKDGRRYISFVGTTALPGYFVHTRISETFEGKDHVYRRFLSKGRWVFTYNIDCDGMKFDRAKDGLGWRTIRLDTTALLAAEKFCEPSAWAQLAIRPQKN